MRWLRAAAAVAGGWTIGWFLAALWDWMHESPPYFSELDEAYSTSLPHRDSYLDSLFRDYT